MKKSLFIFTELLLLVAAALLVAGDARAQSRVCSDPAAPCGGDRFDPYDISHALPRRIVPNRDYTSAPFYAVILRSLPETEDCEAYESERLGAQELFPRHKVFSQVECPDMGADTYREAGRKPLRNFMAVYAGQTAAQAAAFLKTVQATKRFPRARLARLTTTYNMIEQ
jgi:hypothetical protein